MIGLTPVRCLLCRQLVDAEVQRVPRPPRMLRHDANGAPCAGVECEPADAEAKRQRKAQAGGGVWALWGKVSRLGTPAKKG